MEFLSDRRRKLLFISVLADPTNASTLLDVHHIYMVGYIQAFFVRITEFEKIENRGKLSFQNFFLEFF